MQKKYCPFSFNVVQKTDDNYNYDENNNLSNNTHLLQKLLDLSNANKANAAVGRKYLDAAYGKAADDETRKKINSGAEDMVV